MKKKVLFIKSSNSSFILQDENFLKEKFQVKTFFFYNPKGISMILLQLRLFFWMIGNIRKCKAMYVWFADYHSFLPSFFSKVFGKKCFIVIGGYDAERDDNLKYGANVKPLRRWMVKKSCRWATNLLCVSGHTKSRLGENIGKQMLEKCEVVYNGVAPGEFGDCDSMAKSDQAICVALISDARTFKIKGIDRFIESAKILSNYKFILIGLNEEWKGKVDAMGIRNLETLGPLKREELKKYYCASKVVTVFSRYESFSMVAAEAMLSGCVLVTVPGIGTAEIAEGGAGVIAHSQDVEGCHAAIGEGMRNFQELNLRSRKRIIGSFSLEIRKEKIFSLLDG